MAQDLSQRECVGKQFGHDSSYHRCLRRPICVLGHFQVTHDSDGMDLRPLLALGDQINTCIVLLNHRQTRILTSLDPPSLLL